MEPCSFLEFRLLDITGTSLRIIARLLGDWAGSLLAVLQIITKKRGSVGSRQRLFEKRPFSRQKGQSEGLLSSQN
jgi:hypothetical protein